MRKSGLRKEKTGYREKKKVETQKPSSSKCCIVQCLTTAYVIRPSVGQIP